MTFVYNGGEEFRFSGDDDLWVFINNRLAIDLGGLHGPQDDRLDLDAMANELGSRPGRSTHSTSSTPSGTRANRTSPSSRRSRSRTASPSLSTDPLD